MVHEGEAGPSGRKEGVREGGDRSGERHRGGEDRHRGREEPRRCPPILNQSPCHPLPTVESRSAFLCQNLPGRRCQKFI